MRLQKYVRGGKKEESSDSEVEVRRGGGGGGGGGKKGESPLDKLTFLTYEELLRKLEKVEELRDAPPELLPPLALKLHPYVHSSNDLSSGPRPLLQTNPTSS